MVKIIRYSIHGFKPQYQSHHLEYINYHINNFNITDYPEHLQHIIQQSHDKLLPFYKDHYDDFKEEIWFFIDRYKDNLSLNHLQHKVPYWEAEIEDNVIVYDPNWEEIITLDNPVVESGGCYLPKREIYKVHNIKKRMLNKRSI